MWEFPIAEFESFIKYINKESQIAIEENKPIVTLNEEDNNCVINLDFNRETIEIIRQIKGRKYLSETKTWVIPIEEKIELINKLKVLDVIIGTEL